MSKKFIKLIDKFPVLAESKDRYEIFVFQQFTIDNSLTDKPRRIPGYKYYQTSNREKVQMINSNTFEIVSNFKNVVATRV